MQSPFPNAVRLPGLAPGSNGGGGGGGGKPLPNRPGTANNEHTWAQETLGKAYLISIDFGTTRSGIAWAIVDEAANTTRGSVVPIQIHSAPASSNLEAGLPASEKCDTILVMPDGGPDEIGPALFLDRSNIQGKGFMARDFKMLLDVKTRGGNVNLHETSVQLEPLSVLSGDAPKMPLLEVVSRFLKVAGKVAFAKLAQQLRNMHLEVPSKDQVKWVITVPAIWTDQARIFMREATLKAELITGDAFNDQVSICLEPEGAALHSFSEWAAQDQDLKDHKFAIIDLGGGTADITVHNVSAWAPRVKLVTFDEIHPPSGGDWGGRRISTAFENRVLQPLLGPDGFAKFKRNAAVALYFHLETLAPHLQLLDAGRVVDYETPGQPSRAAQSDCVLNLRDLLDDLDELGAKDINLQAGVQAFNAARPKEEHISVERRASVRIPLVVLRQLFDEVLVPLKRHLAELFSALKKKGMTVSTAFLVGGLGSNHFVHRHLEEFHRSLGVMLFRPTDTGLAIVRGAVYFGRNASAFGKCLARTNYGLQVYNRDDPSKPRFSCFIKKLENLQEVAKRSEATPFGPYKPLTEKTTTVRLALYESEEEVQHTTDPRCSFIASIDVDVDLTVPYSERKYLLKLNMDKTVITGYFVEKSSGKEHPIRWSDR